MIKKCRNLCGFLTLFFVLTGFAATNGNNSNSVVATDPLKPIVVKQAQPMFTVILQSNPTTGFSWALKSYDENFIKPVKRVYVAGPRGLIGSGGYEKWTFAVKPSGFVVPQTTNITLIYSRAWELEGAQATNFKVVTINDN